MPRLTNAIWLGWLGCAPFETSKAGPGEVTPQRSEPCPSFLPDDARCRRVVVGCPEVADLGATLVVTEPVEPAAGTVVLHSGGRGVAPLDDGFVPGLVERGFRAVQILWDDDWQVVEPRSVRSAACRPATALAWIHDEYHEADRASGYCAIGHSAGSAAVASALAHYGAGALLDHALLSAGPVFSRMDLGCDPVASGADELTRPSGCAELPDAVFVYSRGHAQDVVHWSGEETCGTPFDDLVDVEGLRAQSLLSDDAVLAYPRTRLDTWWCAADEGGAAGQGSLFADRVTSELERHCATGCVKERSWDNPAELAAMIDTVARECVPRH